MSFRNPIRQIGDLTPVATVGSSSLLHTLHPKSRDQQFDQPFERANNRSEDHANWVKTNRDPNEAKAFETVTTKSLNNSSYLETDLLNQQQSQLGEQEDSFKRGSPVRAMSALDFSKSNAPPPQPILVSNLSADQNCQLEFNSPQQIGLLYHESMRMSSKPNDIG